MSKLESSTWDRFWACVEKTETCWLWTRGTTAAGYGRLSVKGERCYAHRLSYEIHIGPIPHGLYVLHDCDQPNCVRPDHLFLGTHLDNIQDMYGKNRHSLVPLAIARQVLTLHPELRIRGSRHGMAKLNEEIVREIRRWQGEIQARPAAVAAFAQRFGVHKYTIQSIMRGTSWTHVKV